MSEGCFHIFYALFSSEFQHRAESLIVAPKDYLLLTSKSPTLIQTIDTSPFGSMAAILRAFDTLGAPRADVEVCMYVLCL
jgi:myosin heavy subunit